jgi:hypothetical protein
MLKTTTKTIKSLPKLKLKIRRRRNRDESQEKMNQMGRVYMPIFLSELPTEH